MFSDYGTKIAYIFIFYKGKDIILYPNENPRPSITDSRGKKIIANQFLTIGYFINISSFYDFLYGISNGIKHFAR